LLPVVLVAPAPSHGSFLENGRLSSVTSARATPGAWKPSASPVGCGVPASPCGPSSGRNGATPAAQTR